MPRSCDVGMIVSLDETSGDADALSVNAGLVTGMWYCVAGVFDAERSGFDTFLRLAPRTVPSYNMGINE